MCNERQKDRIIPNQKHLNKTILKLQSAREQQWQLTSCSFFFFASKWEKDKIRWEFEGRTKVAGVISYISQKQK